MSKRRLSRLPSLAALAALALPGTSQALELDWSGQFRTEFNFVHNYGADNSDAASIHDTTRDTAEGYYIPSGGTNDANWQTLFLRLDPKVIVNDNIYIKSEWWVGDPVFGMFGNGVPYTTDQKWYNSTSSRGSMITAQRFWGEFLSDIGTFQVGRAPLNWGLGVLWSAGDGVWDKYQSTGDVLRLVAKFGAFSVTPQIITYSMGNTFAGSCIYAGGAGTVCNPGIGGGSVVDYSIALKYENPDEDFEGGVNFIKRLTGSSIDSTTGFVGPVSDLTGNRTVAMNYNTFDLYARKRFGRLSLAGEAPIVAGSIGGVDYSSFTLATEANWRASDMWELSLRAGRVPGQPNSDGPGLPDYKAFYFHPNYKIGMIMFNYQLANFSGPKNLNSTSATESRLLSPYDNPISNANYLSVNGILHADKWDFNLGLVYAQANEAALAGKHYFNVWTRKNSAAPATADQSKSLGWELDWGTGFQWDEYFRLSWDFGLFKPGAFYAFSDSPVSNQTDFVFASSFRIGVTF
jgi:hypothetical protein